MWTEGVLKYCIDSIKSKSKSISELAIELNKAPQSIRRKLYRSGYTVSELSISVKKSECLHCAKSFEHNINCKRKFCNRSCSVSFSNKNKTHRENTKNSISSSLKKRNSEIRTELEIEYNLHPNLCRVCFSKLNYEHRHRKTCSIVCSKKRQSIGGESGGKKSSQLQSETRRSKNEILFSELCKEHFNVVLTNESIFNGWDADVIIEDIKVAVLWNGKWHYEKITEKHSVKQVQNRDKIKIDEIKKCGYIPYVIKDMGSFSEYKVRTEFKKFIKKYIPKSSNGRT